MAVKAGGVATKAGRPGGVTPERNKIATRPARGVIWVNTMAATHGTGPWQKPAPSKTTGAKLTPENIAWAKARAKAAGRRYPNLVDNMAAARRQRETAPGGERDHP